LWGTQIEGLTLDQAAIRVPNGGLITTPRKRSAVRKRKPVHRAERHDTASHGPAASSRSDGAVRIAKQIHACCASCGRADPTRRSPIPGHRPSPLASQEPPQAGPWRERRPTQRQSVQNARTYRPPQKVLLPAQRWSETVVRCLAVVERHLGSRVIRAYTNA
jgi:hypothetical protein